MPGLLLIRVLEAAKLTISKIIIFIGPDIITENAEFVLNTNLRALVATVATNCISSSREIHSSRT